MVEWAELIGLSVLRHSHNETQLHKKMRTILEDLYGREDDVSKVSENSNTSPKNCSQIMSLSSNPCFTAAKDRNDDAESVPNSGNRFFITFDINVNIQLVLPR